MLLTLFRLKQMEDEFDKYVNVAEIAKDMNLPKELATRVHKYWTLKRKVHAIQFLHHHLSRSE